MHELGEALRINQQLIVQDEMRSEEATKYQHELLALSGTESAAHESTVARLEAYADKEMQEYQNKTNTQMEVLQDRVNEEAIMGRRVEEQRGTERIERREEGIPIEEGDGETGG